MTFEQGSKEPNPAGDIPGSLPPWWTQVTLQNHTTTFCFGVECQSLAEGHNFSKTQFGTPQLFSVIRLLRPRFLVVLAEQEYELSIVSSLAFSPELWRPFWDRWVNRGSSLGRLSSKFMERPSALTWPVLLGVPVRLCSAERSKLPLLWEQHRFGLGSKGPLWVLAGPEFHISQRPGAAASRWLSIHPRAQRSLQPRRQFVIQSHGTGTFSWRVLPPPPMDRV